MLDLPDNEELESDDTGFEYKITLEYPEYKFRINDENWETPNPLVSNCTPNEFGGYNRLHVIVAGQNSLQWYFNDENGN